LQKLLNIVFVLVQARQRNGSAAIVNGHVRKELIAISARDQRNEQGGLDRLQAMTAPQQSGRLGADGV
jgi:hypothetical protein